jgi:hypothetical protein
MMIFCFLVMLFVDFCLNRDYVCDIIRCTDVLRASLASVELSVGATNDVDSLANSEFFRQASRYLTAFAFFFCSR